jgi:hypothetical protein
VRIARGPDGFKITVEPTVQAYVDEIIAAHPEFQWRWEAVLARLAAAGHIEGTAVGNEAQRAGTFNLDSWRVRLAWRVLGEGLRVVRAEF